MDSEEKFVAISKGAMMLPKDLLLYTLKNFHNDFYDQLGKGLKKHPFNYGIMEGFKRMIRLVESMECNPVPWPQEKP